MFRQRGGNGKGNKRSAAAADAQLKKRVKVHSSADPNEIVHHSISSGGTVSTTTTYQRPEDVTIIKKLPEPALPPPQKQPAPTQTAKILADFKKQERFLQRGIIQHEANKLFGTPCACAREHHICEVVCHDCTEYRPSCRSCFVELHRNNPFHWAEIWSTEKGFLERHDLSRVLEGQAVSFGHYGHECAKAKAEEHKMLFTIADDNGIHGTSVRFCRCGSAGVDRCQQLLDARIFPCTLDGPCSGIMFNCMKKFQLLSLESKIAAYNYVGSLSRVTDNSFTETVPDLYENFMRCARIWGVLTLKKRLGQEHGIDEFIPLRPKGNLVLYCPSCPEPGFNSDEKLRSLPAHLKQLNQSRDTMDGNFHANRSKKNTDPNDTSLYGGTSYFPSDAFLKEQLAKAPKTEEKLTCNYLKAVNNQDKKKFKNMDITGIVNVQCSHVFVKSSVDLQFGERYANVDIALGHALRQKLASLNKDGTTNTIFELAMGVDHILSYDAICQYSVNVADRFKANDQLKDLAPIVKRMRFSIPFLHVQGHQEGCIYAFSTAYMLGTTHFHGETAEQYWPELNQIGPQTRQMNGGHRHDTIINHHSHWNYTKMSKAVALLLKELMTGEELFALHLNQFLSLSASYASRIRTENWLQVARKPDTTNMKAVKSPYKYETTKVPSQSAIYQKMLDNEKRMPNSETTKSKAATFLNEGMRIQELQLKVRVAVAANKDHPTVTGQRAVATQREKLRTRIGGFRKIQSTLTPAVIEVLGEDEACEVEVERLGLPSEFEEQTVRVKLNLVAMAGLEGRLREGAAFDALHKIQTVAKALVSMSDRKKKNDSGVAKNTISSTMINDTIERRDTHIQSYMMARRAMIVLKYANETEFPPLKAEDTYMKSRNKRELGASRKVDPTWTRTGVRAEARLPIPASTSTTPTSTAPAPGATQMTKRKTAPRKPKTVDPTARKPSAKKPKRKEDGWIWKMGRVGKMTGQEMDAWVKEGDRVQWFRAEAEMQRWQEEVEAKLAELRTTFRSFALYKEAWTKMANCQDASDIGHIAYAKQKAEMFRRREEEGRDALRRTAPKYASLAADDTDLVEFVTAERAIYQEMFQRILEADQLASEREKAAEEEAEDSAELEENEEDSEDWSDED
ncbi:hypothetical protein C8F04DRAFT_1198692 [Mycena alexandri]|uniref:CxC2-like cysteine cluster KDZ transposase-associated domain-containing protein n=1 Tax=Mycena alexandri TaxID=1745969 RepID=A0AAD6WMZ4_9AGAR|nr:hypothetical protein C8F04DRAFT_1198692 [Mycena alexandri]